MRVRGKGCENVTQHNTEDAAICDPSIRVLGRLLSARKIRLSGISSASPLGVAPRESCAYTELAGYREQMNTRKDSEILDERTFLLFGIESHVKKESEKDGLKKKSQLHINTRDYLTSIGLYTLTYHNICSFSLIQVSVYFDTTMYHSR